MKAANLGVLFLIELGALAAAAWWGASTAWPWLLATTAPAVLIAAWALFGSPRARFRTRGARRAGFELLWFGAGVGALYAAGEHGWALALALVCAVSKGLAWRWDQ
ncbi:MULTISPECIES: YrdB family protein [Streptomyces]|uniref:YrdB family protein n=1 Tax=Streptomyces TaxID=1883 RepID=UPI002119E4FA|nr:YrdB family protein [Streptomyces hilarionis]MCQ9133326.1 YrdB family protein [Streptomyces hilarionis]